MIISIFNFTLPRMYYAQDGLDSTTVFSETLQQHLLQVCMLRCWSYRFCAILESIHSCRLASKHDGGSIFYKISRLLLACPWKKFIFDESSYNLLSHQERMILESARASSASRKLARNCRRQDSCAISDLRIQSCSIAYCRRSCFRSEYLKQGWNMQKKS